MPPSPGPDTCFCYLLRHGATDNNLANPPLLQGNSVDGPLSGEGVVQARAASAELAEQLLHAIYCSPLKRARETAEIVAAPHEISPQVISEISEVDVGSWEGRTWVEIEQSEPDHYRRFMDDPALYGYRGGESLNDVHARVVPAINRLLSDHVGQRIAVVAHNVVNRVLLAEALKMPLAQARSLSQDNCGINVLRYRDGELKLVSMNSILHHW